MSLLQRLAYGKDFDVISLFETWLNPTVLDNKVLSGYNIFRRDRDDRGGGVSIAVKSNIHSCRRIDLEREGTELVVVELTNGHDKPCLLYCFYHPDDSLGPLFELNLSLCENNESTCLVVKSDFNLPELDWSGDQSAPINTGSRADDNIFCELLGDNFFSAVYSWPYTHYGYQA